MIFFGPVSSQDLPTFNYVRGQTQWPDSTISCSYI